MGGYGHLTIYADDDIARVMLNRPFSMLSISRRTQRSPLFSPDGELALVGKRPANPCDGPDVWDREIAHSGDAKAGRFGGASSSLGAMTTRRLML